MAEQEMLRQPIEKPKERTATFLKSDFASVVMAISAIYRAAQLYLQAANPPEYAKNIHSGEKTQQGIQKVQETGITNLSEKFKLLLKELPKQA